MKRVIVSAIALLFTLGIAYAQNDWVIHKCDNRISVKFPSEPKEIQPGSFTANLKDSTVACIFTCVDFSKVANIDSTTLAPLENTADFAAELKTGLESHLSDVKMNDLTIGKWNGFNSYSTWGIDSKKKRYDFFMVIIGNNLYSLTTITGFGALFETRDTFFSSIVLTNN